MIRKYKIFIISITIFFILFLFILPKTHPIRLAAKLNLRPVILYSIYVLKSLGKLSTSLQFDHLAAVMADLLYDVGNNAIKKDWNYETKLAAESIRNIGITCAKKSMNETARMAVIRLWELNLQTNEYGTGDVVNEILFNLILLTAQISDSCPHLMDFALQKLDNISNMINRETFNKELQHASVWAKDVQPELVNGKCNISGNGK